jgi:putative CocE/NonD family hydrolase
MPRSLFLLLLAAALQAQPTYPNLPSETPAQLTPKTDTFDYTRREAMIAMRDGVKLHAVILVPKGAKNAPILLTRTPYNAKELTSHAESSHLGPILQGYDNAVETIIEGGYIRVIEDIRGKYGSEGDYVMNRPLHGPQNPTPVDHATDTYDTIDWLVKNIPESNGRVGILGISYDGFLPLMAVVNPHPALKVSVPMNPMVDGWMGDDWFHNGAFRQQNMPYIYEQRQVVDQQFRRLRHVHERRLGRRVGTHPRTGASRLLAQAAGTSHLRQMVARSGHGQGARRATAEGAHDAGA